MITLFLLAYIYIAVTSINPIEVCDVAAIIYHWVVTVLCLSKVDRNNKYTL